MINFALIILLKGPREQVNPPAGGGWWILKGSPRVQETLELARIEIGGSTK